MFSSKKLPLLVIFQTPQAYKDSDFKQYWMPDSNCKQCYECGDKFNTFRRRHHCRICGQIFCSRCCNQEVPGKIMGYTGGCKAGFFLLFGNRPQGAVHKYKCFLSGTKKQLEMWRGGSSCLLQHDFISETKVTQFYVYIYTIPTMYWHVYSKKS